MTATWIDQEWRVNASCAKTGHPEAWSLPRPRQDHEPADPDRAANHAANQVAIRICRRCPVRRACARYALTTDPYPFGVILAGVPCRREPSGQPSPRSLELLRSIAGDAA